MGYEYLEHTSDAKFRATGRDIEEVFSNAALALTGLITDPTTVRETQSHEVDLSARNLASLLYDFLTEVLYLFEAEHFLTARADVQVEEGERMRLTATLFGDDRTGYPLEGSVKSITYNEMDITKTADGHAATVVIDQ